MTTATSTVPTPAAEQWWLYLLECQGGRIYTGIATDVLRRCDEHARGRGARFTRAFAPLRLLGCQAHPDHRSAAQAEVAIKKLSSGQKRQLALSLLPTHPWPRPDESGKS